MTNPARHRGRAWSGAVVLASFALVALVAGCGGGNAGIGRPPPTREDANPPRTSRTTRSRPTASTIEPGLQGIALVQAQLNALGCEAGTVDGAIGTGTTAAITRFQTAAGLAADGVAGPETTARLTEAVAAGSPNCRGGGSRNKSAAATTVPPDQPDCSRAVLRAAAERYLGDDVVEDTKGSDCSGDWAYVFVLLQGESSEPGMEFEGTLVLRWDAGARIWNVVDRGEPCRGREVPEEIYDPACNTN
jgi:hypothetical protein